MEDASVMSDQWSICIKVMIAQWETECISLSVLSVARVMIAKIRTCDSL